MTAEAPQSDTGSSISDPVDTTKSYFSSCLECMADYFSRIWSYVSEAFSNAWQWISDSCNCHRCANHQAQERVTIARPRRTNLDSANKNRLSSGSPQQVIAASSPQAPKAVDIRTDVVHTNQSKPESPTQNSNHIHKPPSPTGILKTRTQIAVSQSEQQNGVHEPAIPEPPKIDFVETGSIFGDRKKTGVDHTMLQIENGRFRSPGLSKVIPGPNGRQIRVSFVSGFPSIKSIESRNSLASVKAWSKRSFETVTHTGTPPMAAARSAESIKGMKTTFTLKSNRSLKSASSADSKEGESMNVEADLSNKQV